MKKLLKVLPIITFTTIIAWSATACANEPDWNIPVPPPQVPIDVTGFVGVDFQAMNIKDYDTIDKLFATIKTKFANSIWKNAEATTWNGTKEGKVINLKTTDLKRNGQYTFEIKSNLTLPGDAKFIITINSSKHIADNISSTNIGTIDDDQAKTILIGCVFKNMNLVNIINEMADEYLNNITVHMNGNIEIGKPVTGSATLNSPTNANYFYGTVTLNFTVLAKAPPNQPTPLAVLIKTTNLKNISDNRQYTILMWVITYNLKTQLNLLSEIINNVEVTNITINNATISAINGSKYFTGSVDINFKIEK